MDAEIFKQWLKTQERQAAALERMAIALERLAPEAGAPNLQKPIAEFKGFDWSTIGASVVQRDQYGAAVVEWGGKQFTRRSPDNKFGAAIWFSRSTGEKDEQGRNQYERLITFKVLHEAEPIGSKASARLN